MLYKEPYCDGKAHAGYDHQQYRATAPLQYPHTSLMSPPKYFPEDRSPENGQAVSWINVRPQPSTSIKLLRIIRSTHRPETASNTSGHYNEVIILDVHMIHFFTLYDRKDKYYFLKKVLRFNLYVLYLHTTNIFFVMKQPNN